MHYYICTLRQKYPWKRQSAGIMRLCIEFIHYCQKSEQLGLREVSRSPSIHPFSALVSRSLHQMFLSSDSVKSNRWGGGGICVEHLLVLTNLLIIVCQEEPIWCIAVSIFCPTTSAYTHSSQCTQQGYQRLRKDLLTDQLNVEIRSLYNYNCNCVKGVSLSDEPPDSAANFMFQLVVQL